MIQIEIVGDPPNKQGFKAAPDLIEKLKEIREHKLKSGLIDSDIKIDISLHYHHLRFRRSGYDNTYIGDLDNIVSGICDILKNNIIVDDSQITEIRARRYHHNGYESRREIRYSY